LKEFLSNLNSPLKNQILMIVFLFYFRMNPPLKIIHIFSFKKNYSYFSFIPLIVEEKVKSDHELFYLIE